MRSALLIFLSLAGLALGQSRKHLTVAPRDGARPSTLTANEIERGVQYPSSIHLKGEVVIKTPFCTPAEQQGKVLCAGEMIVRADEATYHEDTGKIDASGTITVTPVHPGASESH